MATRQRIIQEATAYFNQAGFGATSFLELANALGMSRGNLTYHFKDKDVLLEAIVEEMWTQMDQERVKSRQLPSFENLHNEVQLYYRLQRTYAFIFLDSLVLNHPVLKDRFRSITAQAIEDNKAIIAFAVQLGNMQPEAIAGTYNNIAFVTWMLTFFWLPQQIIRGEKTGEDGEKMIWSMLLPHFTEKGVSSFKAFFGEAYYQNLGEPFSFQLDQFISF